jgi:hypothetical protein
VLAEMVQTWQAALLRCARQSIEQGHLKIDTDAQQLVYEMYGLVLALHHDARFLRIPGSVARAQRGFERLIESYKQPAADESRNAVTIE